MKLYRHEFYNTYGDGRPEWEYSSYDDEIWLHRENAERALIPYAAKIIDKRAADWASKRETAVAENAARRNRATQWATLVAAGLEPGEFMSKPKEPTADLPVDFDWDDPEYTTLTDEQIGYRVIEIETVDFETED